jgi:ArsR family transcriptional regulator
MATGETTASEHLSAAAAEDRVRKLKALGNEARFRIMELIHEHGGEICVCEFAGRLDLSQPTISHHLKVLREAGLIESRQKGTWVYHTVRRAAVGELVDRLASWADAPAPGAVPLAPSCGVPVGRYASLDAESEEA